MRVFAADRACRRACASDERATVAEMARQPRLQGREGAYHVSARASEGRALFLDDADRVWFLHLLARAIGEHGWRCHAYCLLGNHFHLLLHADDGALASGMQLVNGGYAARFNARYAHVGHVFQGRYHSLAIEGERHLLEACRYVVLNPVRAGLCLRPGAWRWSNYRATAGLDPPPSFLELRWLLAHFSAQPARARVRYAEFVADGVSR